jgi:soluble lytic murein transglycosylase-like protein
MRIDPGSRPTPITRAGIAALGLFCSAGFAADRQPVAASPYQLVMPSPESFRVANAEQYRLAQPPRVPAPALAEKPFAREIDAAARSAKLDPALLHAVIHVESRHQAAALSPKGAMGLMQVMPETGARFGVPRPDQSVAANLKAGSLYLRSLMQQFDGRLDLVLAAYNAGENAVLRYAMTIPPYAETRRYVPAVMAKYDEWRDVEEAPRRIDYLAGTRLTGSR